MVELVVAHYKEDLSWLHAYQEHMPANAHITIYCRNQSLTLDLGPQVEVVPLPNVGREVSGQVLGVSLSAAS